MIEWETGSTVFKRQIASPTINASFFAEEDRLYFNALAVNGRAVSSSHRIVKLADSTVAERLSSDLHIFEAVRADKLIRTEAEKEIEIVEVPDYDVARRIPLAAAPNDRWQRASSLCLSMDRSIVIYDLDAHHIICRNLEDLSLLWSRRVDEQAFPRGITHRAISPDGRCVAVSAVQNRFLDRPGRGIIHVLDTSNGDMIGQIQVAAIEPIGISPNGALLAAGHRNHYRGGETISSIHLYDLRSGRQVAELEHNRLVLEPGQLSFGSFSINGIVFTPDGRHLITSGLHTNIWSLF